mmetsp:Transcript_2008/g.7776  ORF Transcript_2008/g.7776 Transcript_2008/m.7776 type:complete len:261 (+) Transcript_2008:1620-2402(+)
MSYWCTVTYASAYTGSLNPVSCNTRSSFRSLSLAAASANPVALAKSVATASSISTCDKPFLDFRWKKSIKSSACATGVASRSTASCVCCLILSSIRPLNASRHPFSHTSATAGSRELGAAKVFKQSDRRSALSSSIGVGSVCDLPKRSKHTMYSITSALRRCASACVVATERKRSASLVSVVATTDPRKKSPPSTSALKLGAPAPPLRPFATTSTTAVCVAYEPSANTCGRPVWVFFLGGDEKFVASSCVSGCSFAFIFL